MMADRAGKMAGNTNLQSFNGLGEPVPSGPAPAGGLFLQFLSGETESDLCSCKLKSKDLLQAEIKKQNPLSFLDNPICNEGPIDMDTFTKRVADRAGNNNLLSVAEECQKQNHPTKCDTTKMGLNLGYPALIRESLNACTCESTGLTLATTVKV
ncbi:unnamed protein product [Amoebophrya sp. A120]|nr:unnamed protein product [Amoebophrya sp. A120]|eukprot:GSA120T00014784001.1